MTIIYHILVTALGLLIAAYFIPGIEVSGFYIAIIAAIILGLLNLIVRPVILLLTLPINIITLGLFTFVINAFMFWFAASFIEGFSVTGFIPALLGSILVSIFTTVALWLID
jgi:putative membrane protein